MPVPTKMRRRGSADNRRNVWRRLALAAASMGVYRANRFSMSILPGDFFGASERRGHSLRTIAPHSRHTGARTAPIARSALRADVHCFQRPVRAWSSHGQPIAIRPDPPYALLALMSRRPLDDARALPRFDSPERASPRADATDEPLDMGGASAQAIGRRSVNVRWLGASVLIGVAGAALLGAAIYV